ncbi:Excinuclease ABC C subunit domain protein [Pseudodesulfovibrio profundus]|uniref:Excinuclease ABC C subunit domain protein n=1 Tax=Pseudodesulfovibrio profundus TaxID=57320 RepID=A0A2C8F361_9BACT|nr:GIY-YIG nuclease family protein [Pseudodesulfovibrio profundus]SOB57033.1 Excinuclease ABC C subunit domain protein [Pseudodesulfovibrio profundus]
MSKWFVYLLRCADDTLYCGITNDLKRRLTQHNTGKASKYTRPRRPVSIETYTEVSTKSAALKLEIQVKKRKKNEKVFFLDSFKKPTTS